MLPLSPVLSLLPPPLALLPPLALVPPLALLPPEEDPDVPPELLDASFPASELPCPEPPPLHAVARARRSDEERPSR